MWRCSLSLSDVQWPENHVRPIRRWLILLYLIFLRRPVHCDINIDPCDDQRVFEAYEHHSSFRHVDKPFGNLLLTDILDSRLHILHWHIGTPAKIYSTWKMVVSKEFFIPVYANSSDRMRQCILENQLCRGHFLLCGHNGNIRHLFHKQFLVFQFQNILHYIATNNTNIFICSRKKKHLQIVLCRNFLSGKYIIF